jgi:hypothetical protein
MSVWRRRAFSLALGTVCIMALAAYAVPAAYADGNAGVVVEHGDGSIDTYCVAFRGDSISASELLAKAGIPDVQWNGSVCAIGSDPAEGCFQPHDYASCYCKSYPPTNTYWAFFTQRSDQGWIYSPLGIQSAAAHNGDLQAWRWGVGGPNSAPPPPAMTFAQVCAAPPPATPTAVPPTVTPVAPTVVPISTSTPLTTAAPMTSGPTSPAAGTATTGPGTAATVTATTSVTITNHGSVTATPAPAPSHNGDGGSGAASLAAFGGVAALMLAAIAGAVVYRRRHGQ